MSGDPIKLVTSGQPLQIAAQTWNAVTSLLKPTPTISQGSACGASATVLIKNTTAAEVRRFGLLELNGPIFELDGTTATREAVIQQVALRGVAPSLNSSGRFAMLLEPCPPGEIRPAVIRGITYAIINVTDVDMRAVDSSSATNLLQTFWIGSGKILWKEGGTGERLALVDLGPRPVGQVHEVKVLEILGPTNIEDRTWGNTTVVISFRPGGVAPGLAGARPAFGTTDADDARIVIPGPVVGTLALARRKGDENFMDGLYELAFLPGWRYAVEECGS